MRILLVTHAFDRDLRTGLFRRPERCYLVQDILEVLASRGHRVRVARGLGRLPRADVAIVHADCSITPGDYRAALGRYPVVINGGITDITKRRISDHLLQFDSSWDGAVVVKSDFNCGGIPERRHNRGARKRGLVPPHPQHPVVGEYPVYDCLNEIPDTVWDDPALVVEKFLPERTPEGYALRNWTFMGAEERCVRCVGTTPIVKGHGIVSRELSAVPDALRAARARLGVEYGKFDFVVYEGTPVLLDVNTTPSRIPDPGGELADVLERFADGFEGLVGAARA